MAVTIHQSPQPFTPSDNPVTWVFSSDQTAQANFSYLVEVYINGNLDSQNTIFPTDGICAWFDAHEITSRSCSFPVVSATPIVDAENYCTCYVKVIERYGSPVGNGANATSSTVTTWKARITDEDFETYDDADYLNNEAFVTQFPSTMNPKIRVDEFHRLMLMSNGDELTGYEAELYDVNDVLIISDSWSGSVDAPMCIINVSPSVIMTSIPSIDLDDFEAAAYYIITVQPTVAAVVSYRIDMNSNHKYSTGARLHALSMIGCIEGFSFDLISRPTSTVESFSYQTKFGYISGNSFVFDSNLGTERDFAKSTTKKLTIESDWLLEDEQHWLVENFYDSPAVWIEQSDGDLKRVKITNTSYAPMIQENDCLVSEKVELIVGQKTSMIL